MCDANTVPASNKYDLPKFELTKNRARQALIKEESAKQKEMQAAKWAKTNKPNPFSYSPANCEKMLSNRRR